MHWSTPVNVSSTNNNRGPEPAVGPNGEVYVVWVGNGFTTQYFNKSTNGGISFSTPKIIAFGLPPYVPFSKAGNHSFPSIAVDITGGARNGYVYVTWCDGRNGDADVFFMRSTDQGSSWSSPVRVNNDPVNNGKCQAWPWIAVNDFGLISILFYDTRNTPADSIVEAWLAFSSDGGSTFSNEVLSSQQSPTDQPNQDVRFGDYIGIDFWGNRIVPVWTDERASGHNQEIYTAVIDITTGIKPVAEQFPDAFKLEQNYPNPFNPVTKITYELPVSNFVKLVIYDILGREIAVLVNEKQLAGKYSVTWDAANYPSGVYFYKLITGDFTQTKKMMLLK